MRWLVWGYVAAYLVWATAMILGYVSRGIVNDLVFMPLYVAPAGAAFVAGWRSRHDARLTRGWWLFGIAWTVSGLGTLLWVVYDALPLAIIERSAWAMYNLYFPATVAALWFLLPWPATSAGRAKLLLNGLMVVVTTATLAWYSVIRYSHLEAFQVGILSRVGILFPGELAVVFGAAMLMSRPTGGLATWPALLASGTIFASIADIAYDHSNLVGTPGSGAVGDMLLALAGGLVAAAALGVPETTTHEGRGRPVAVDTGLTVLPYVATAIVAVLLIAEFWRQDIQGPISGLILGGCGLMMLVIARLHLAQREFLDEATARAAQGERFRSLVQRSSDAILVICNHGIIRYASPAFTRLVGAADAAVTGQPLQQFIDPAYVKQLLAGSGTSPGKAERWQVTAGAGTREVDAVMTDLRSDPSVNGVVVNLRDVTESVQLEAQLRQSQKLEVVGKLSSSIAHDFNNLLSVVLGNAKLAQLLGPGDRTDEWAAVSLAAERGGALARQLLALSRPTPLRARTLDLVAEVRATQKTLRAVLPSSLSVTLDVPDAPVLVSLDDVQLEQVLLNLAINARDAMGGEGELAIAVGVHSSADFDDDAHAHAPAGTWSFVRLRDTGRGMDTSTLSRAFEPFFTTKASGLGTGLGLSTVRDIVTSAGGTVTLASEVEKGTTVTVYLPLATMSDVDASSRREAAPARGMGRLLVVDDEPALRKVFAKYLTRLGYEVFQAEDGVAALELLDTHQWAVDLVLTDLVMPRMGGEALVGRIQDSAPHLPVLCMSGTPGAVGKGSSPWSAEKVLTKPVALDLLSTRIREALAAAQPSDPFVVRAPSPSAL
ncbi:MAG: response regulator [Gemmatimonadaceae bacterium]|nr:response regulator [Gemmatimonadaceae bacterium]